jgi:hypothetical protein
MIALFIRFASRSLRVFQDGSPTVGFSKELCGKLRVKTEGTFVVGVFEIL